MLTLKRLFASLIPALASVPAIVAAPAAHAAPAAPGLVPSVMQFKLDYNATQHDAPQKVDDYVRKALNAWDDGVTSMRPIKAGCITTSGSAGGWDDSDYWGNGC